MTPPNPTEPAAKNRIVAVAHERFMASGFNSVTMDDIARELGMSKKTLYEFFPGKTELLREAMKFKCDNWQKEMNAIAKETTGFFERARRTFRFIAQMYAKLSQSYLTDLRRCAPEVWSDMQKFRRGRVRGNILDLLRQGIREGVLRKDLDPEALADLYLTMTTALINPETSGLNSGLEISAAFETFIRVYFEGLIVGAGHRRDCAKASFEAKGS